MTLPTKRAPYRYRPGHYSYRGFNIRRKGWRWIIMDGNGEEYRQKSLVAAAREIDRWYEGGTVV